MCIGKIYRMTRCNHSIAHYTSHCRRYQCLNPPTTPAEGLVIPEPLDEPCPHLHSGDNDNEPVAVVPIDDSCARCMPRMKRWEINRQKARCVKAINDCVEEYWRKGDRLGAATERDRLNKLNRGAEEEIAAIDWSIIPAPELVYPPCWTVEDDRGLSAAWIGRQLVWDNKESLRELQQLYKKEEEKQRQHEEEEVEEELEYDEEEEEVQTILKDDDDYSSYSSYEETRTGYHISEDEYGDQDLRSGSDPQTTYSHRGYPQLRKQRGREVLGESEFLSFSNLKYNDDHDSYHIDDNDDDDEDIWLKVGSLPPRDDKTTITGFPLRTIHAP
ncbi:hypothetical protein PG994_000364 [Apiospora phragmitis]|uniref:Uncharacterized protein n=1 Tax=Apiospora phragmitis TaxID=2905665 RepID=A0ABR1X689_9PEZI